MPRRRRRGRLPRIAGHGAPCCSRSRAVFALRRGSGGGSALRSGARAERRGRAGGIGRQPAQPGDVPPPAGQPRDPSRRACGRVFAEARAPAQHRLHGRDRRTQRQRAEVGEPRRHRGRAAREGHVDPAQAARAAGAPPAAAAGAGRLEGRRQHPVSRRAGDRRAGCARHRRDASHGRRLARRAAAHAARRSAAHRLAGADPRCGAELAAAPGAAGVRRALPALRPAARRARHAAGAVVSPDALGQCQRRRWAVPASTARSA